MHRRQFLQYASLAGTGFAFAACSQGNNSNSSTGQSNSQASPLAANEPLKVGFVYVGPVGDFGWTHAHDLGRREMEANLKGKVVSKYVESVSEGADAERVIRQLALDGNKLIFTTSFGFMNPTLKVAKNFPNVAFEHCTGYKRAANVGTYMGRFEEPRYLTGMIAGKMTKSNIIGYLGAFPIPEVIRGIGAFTQGLRAVNPKATVKVVWVQSWYDPAKERDAAGALINAGADVLAQHTDSAATVGLAQERGIYAFGYNTDMSKFGAKAHLTSAINTWGEFYTAKAQAVLDGTWKPQNVWAGIGEGMVDISPMNDAIGQDVQKLVMAKRLELIKGTAHPFEGPVKDQTGTVRVPLGQVLDDQAQLAMDWYVQGIEGAIPKGASS